MTLAIAAGPETAGGGLRRYLKLAEWQLALPLTLAFSALFLAPLLLLVATSFFNNDKITQPGFASWTKFFGDPFNYKVIADTLLLGLKTVCATVVVGYPLALVYMDLPVRLLPPGLETRAMVATRFARPKLKGRARDRH